MGREKVRISDIQSHNSRGNTKHPQLIQEDGPQDELLKGWLWQRGTGGGTIMNNQAPAYINRESGWHQEILLVARKGQPKGQPRHSNHGSTRTSPKHQIYRGRSLPQLTEPELKTMQQDVRRKLGQCTLTRTIKWLRQCLATSVLHID